MNLFPGTAAILLSERSWISQIGIENWLRNYGRNGHSEGFPFWVIDSAHIGNQFKFQYVNGMWKVTPSR